jgi:hypothetical protein
MATAHNLLLGQLEALMRLMRFPPLSIQLVALLLSPLTISATLSALLAVLLVFFSLAALMVLPALAPILTLPITPALWSLAWLVLPTTMSTCTLTILTPLVKHPPAR